MKVIGLVGGIASGKSFVAEILSQFGARIIDADQLAHRVLEQKPVIDLLVSRWGPEIQAPDGSLRRDQIAKRVFATDRRSRDELAWLEQQIHPRVHQQVEDLLERWKHESVPAVVLDAPVLIKAGWHKDCDEIVYVDCAYDVRLARTRQRGWDQWELKRRESYQTPLEQKRALATFLIHNDISPESTRTQLETFWRQRVL